MGRRFPTGAVGETRYDAAAAQIEAGENQSTMHGVIFSELRKYANARLGPGSWERLLEAADLKGRTYLAMNTYADEDVFAIVGAASAATGLETAAVLEDFGQFIAPDLMAMFKSLVRSEWRTLDLLENTEETMHKVVRLQVKDAAPPYLKAERLSPTHVRIHYTSPRRLCAIAKGIVRGVAEHYTERIAMTESQCMHRGRASCIIDVRV